MKCTASDGTWSCGTPAMKGTRRCYGHTPEADGGGWKGKSKQRIDYGQVSREESRQRTIDHIVEQSHGEPHVAIRMVAHEMVAVGSRESREIEEFALEYADILQRLAEVFTRDGR